MGAYAQDEELQKMVLYLYKDRMEGVQIQVYIIFWLLVFLNSFQNNIKISMSKENISSQEMMEINTCCFLHSFKKCWIQTRTTKFDYEFGVVDIFTCFVYDFIGVNGKFFVFFLTLFWLDLSDRLLYFLSFGLAILVLRWIWFHKRIIKDINSLI